MESEISREDIEMKHSPDGPVLSIKGTEIVLRTTLEVEGGPGQVFGESIELKTELDWDGDNGSWWNVYPKDGVDFPLVTIQPEVRE